MNLKDIFRKRAPGVEGTEQAPASVIDTTVLPIGKEQIAEAYHLLNKYKAGKANLEKKIIENQDWYKARHWEHVGSADDEIQPASAWLFNVLANKHASAMDNIPSASILPREEMDTGEAEALSAVIPVILDGCGFEKTYDTAVNYKDITGAACYSVLWNNDLHNGLGDVDVKMIDLLKIFWEPGITDIQQSRNVFHVELCDNDLLVQMYPQLENNLNGGGFNIAEYRYDDTIDTSNKSAVIDWYYKKKNGTKDILHFVKFVGNTVLFATENDPEYADGWYHDGRYPFEFDVLFPIPGSPAGFGYVDIGKGTQQYIDLLGQSILENALWTGPPRYLAPIAGDVNEKEFADRKKFLVHYSGNGDGIMPIKTNPLPSMCYEVYQGKIDELKETTGNRDVNTGGSTSGVTAASAIAALQEAGSKLDRDDIKASYRAFKGIVLMIIERIRQFYDEARWFRVLGPEGTYRFIQYSNANIRMNAVRFDENGNPISYKMPFFDVEVTAERASAYSKMANNELALQFYQLGFFNPQMYIQAQACLEMMDFDRKSFVMKKIGENGMAYQMMMQQMAAVAPEPIAGGEEVHLSEGAKESSVTANARKRVAESTAPV